MTEIGATRSRPIARSPTRDLWERSTAMVRRVISDARGASVRYFGSAMDLDERTGVVVDSLGRAAPTPRSGDAEVVNNHVKGHCNRWRRRSVPGIGRPRRPAAAAGCGATRSSAKISPFGGGTNTTTAHTKSWRRSRHHGDHASAKPLRSSAIDHDRRRACPARGELESTRCCVISVGGGMRRPSNERRGSRKPPPNIGAARAQDHLK